MSFNNSTALTEISLNVRQKYSWIRDTVGLPEDAFDFKTQQAINDADESWLQAPYHTTIILPQADDYWEFDFGNGTLTKKENGVVGSPESLEDAFGWQFTSVPNFQFIILKSSGEYNGTLYPGDVLIYNDNLVVTPSEGVYLRKDYTFTYFGPRDIRASQDLVFKVQAFSDAVFAELMISFTTA